MNYFGATPTQLLDLVNPTRQSGGVHIGDAATGADGVGGAGTYTSAAAQFEPNALEGLQLVLGGDYTEPHVVASNTSTVLTLAGAPELGSASANYILREVNPSHTLQQFQEAAGHQEGYIRSMLRDPYQAMLSRVEGEILTPGANAQTGVVFTLGISAVTASTVRLWKNVTGDYARRHSDFLPLLVGTDFALVEQVVTLTTALSIQDTLFADYAHNMASPPVVLRDMLLRLTGADLLHSSFRGRGGELNVMAVELREQALTTLTAINDGGDPAGIEEFDKLPLYVESRADATPGSLYGTVSILRNS